MTRPEPHDDVTITIYTPESALRHPARLVGSMFRDLWTGRELAWRLAVRDLSAQYRQTVLGLAWVFLIPLANTLAWLFIQASGAVQIRSGDIPYPVFVITGTLLWSVFMDAVNAPLQQSQAARQMLAKLNFPREALIVSGILQVLFAAVIKMVVLLAALFWLGVAPSASLLLLPVVVVSLVLTGTTVGLAFTPLGLLYTDVGRGLPLMLQFLMYLSPVVYAIPAGGWPARLMSINPLTTLIEFARATMLGTDLGATGAFVAINVAVLVLLLVTWALYRASLPILIERMGA